jgi:hypothetical protein
MTVEQRLEKMETMLTQIFALITGEDRIDGVDEAAYKRAIDALSKGNNKLLEIYMKRGGKIPRG